MKALQILIYIRRNKFIMDLLDEDSINEAIAELQEALKPKTCKTCKHWDTERPRSHPNYAECNNRECPLSYEEVHYSFGCNKHEPKEKQ